MKAEYRSITKEIRLATMEIPDRSNVLLKKLNPNIEPYEIVFTDEKKHSLLKFHSKNCCNICPVS